MSDHDLSLLFHQVDTDQGGEIEIEEFTNWLSEDGDVAVDMSRNRANSPKNISTVHPHRQAWNGTQKNQHSYRHNQQGWTRSEDREEPLAERHAVLLQQVSALIQQNAHYQTTANAEYKEGVLHRKSRHSPTNLIKHKRLASSLKTLTARQSRQITAALDHIGIMSRAGANDLYTMFKKYRHASSTALIDHYGFSLSLRKVYNVHHPVTSFGTLEIDTIDSLWSLLDAKKAGKINIVEFQQWMEQRLQDRVVQPLPNDQPVRNINTSEQPSKMQGYLAQHKTPSKSLAATNMNRRPNWGLSSGKGDVVHIWWAAWTCCTLIVYVVSNLFFQIAVF